MLSIQLNGLSSKQTGELLPENLILLGYRGSIAHGMYIPSSDPDSIDDKDIMGVFIAPIEHYLGFGRDEHKEAFVGEWDAVSYELRKFIRLLSRSNPNVLSILWIPDRHIIYEHEVGSLLRQNKEVFVSKTAYHSFSGYASAQLKRMTHFKFEGYMGERRKRLVEEFGYDTKNAAHLIRLLRMGIEFLSDGRLYVERDDGQELLEIKKGKWTLEKVKLEAEKLFKVAEETFHQSNLPDEIDGDKAERLLMTMIRRYHGM